MQTWKNTIKNRIIVLSATAMLISATVVSALADIAGEWDITLETDADSMQPHFSLKQDDGDVSGTYRDEFGSAKVTGTVKGNDVTLKFHANIPNEDLTVTYTGTVSGTTMQGRVRFGDLGEGTFTGRKR